ncbi:HAMP domain-containing protein [Rhodospirillum centenum]|uniref:HAMP domain protein n=1 Tax=Rhodospirillum centenum (strain ATCC 51521 / SW) TaxID=414684 RepID=B6ING7_RHOCS|nr:HAMP domain-containing protein [Rhodospirillum centenum]ACI99064.1 HAMP domain protein [Rhodospirillum centenum SW]
MPLIRAGWTVRGLSAALALAAVLGGGGILAAGAFNLARFGQVSASLAALPADTAAKEASLESFRERLGQSGFLQSLWLYQSSRAAEPRAAMDAALDSAERDLRAFESRRLDASETALARDLRKLLEGYRQALAAGPEALAGPAGTLLALRHAELADRIAAFHGEREAEAAARLTPLAMQGFWLGLAAAAVAVLLALALLLLLRVRVLAPLAELRRSVEALSRGDWRGGLWGTERTDEFGALARSLEGFRRQVADLPDISVLTEEGRVRLKFDGGAGDLFQAVQDRLRDAGTALAASGTEAEQTLARMKDELEVALAQVQSLCAAVARSAGDSNREIRQSGDLLAQAAAQVRAFDARGPGGGLDGLVDNLRRNAERLAETLADTGQEVGHTLRDLTGSAADIRDSSEQARTATRTLSETIADVQTKMLAAVKVMRAAGELLTGTAGTAGADVGRIVAAVGDAEHALAAALAEATSRLDGAMGAATRRLDGVMEDAAQRLDLALDGATGRLDGALDAATRRMDDATGQIARTAGLLEERGRSNGDRMDAAIEELNTAARTVEQSARVQEDRLAPVVDRIGRIEDALGATAAELASRTGLLSKAVAEIHGLADGLAGEMERRRAEPVQAQLAEQVLDRLHETTALLTQRAEAAGGTAERLSRMLADGLDTVTLRLRDAAAELHQQSRAVATEAAAATTALETSLTAALARQEATTESLRGVADGLAPLAGLPGRSDAATAALAALAGDLGTRLAGLERVAAALGETTATLQALAERSDTAGAERAAAERAAAEAAEAAAADAAEKAAAAEAAAAAATATQAATRELGLRLAEIADQLRATATGMQGTSGLAGTAGLPGAGAAAAPRAALLPEPAAD